MGMTHWLVKYLFAEAEARGVSIRALEKLAGLGTNTIHRWQYRDPNLPKLEMALKALGVSLQAVPARPPYTPSLADGGANIKMVHLDIRA